MLRSRGLPCTGGRLHGTSVRRECQIAGLLGIETDIGDTYHVFEATSVTIILSIVGAEPRYDFPIVLLASHPPVFVSIPYKKVITTLLYLIPYPSADPRRVHVRIKGLVPMIRNEHGEEIRVRLNMIIEAPVHSFPD